MRSRLLTAKDPGGKLTPMPAPQELDTRKALAGIGLLQGKTSKDALIDVGYSPSTARNPKRNGLSEAQCLAEAAKLDPSVSPANLLYLGRQRLLERLTSFNGSGATISEIAKLTDVLERAYGAREPIDALGESRDTADRMGVLQAFMSAWQHLAECRQADKLRQPVEVEPQQVVLSPAEVVVSSEKAVQENDS